jgi:hypothetical protein
MQVQDNSRINPYTGRTYSGGSTYYNTVPSGTNIHVYDSGWNSFGVGMWYGSMMHPWGGYYAVPHGVGYVHQPFSWGMLILDIIILALFVWLIVWMIRRYAR